jgi:NTE family protein
MTCKINFDIDAKLQKIINNYKVPKSKIITNLVLCGGGVRGIALVGALKALDEKGVLKTIKNIAGSSIGGIIGCLIAIGYTPTELYNFIEIFDLAKCKSKQMRDIFTEFGIDNGKNFYCILQKLFKHKYVSPEITFNDLYKKNGIKLIVTTVCINDKSVIYLSNDTVPDMTLIDGLRMTASFPFWFVPVLYKNKLYIDGGCIENYPISVFADELDKTIGIFLITIKEYKKSITNIEDYFLSLIECLNESVNITMNNNPKNTINIHLESVGMLDMKLTKEKKKQIYTNGYITTINWFLK